MQSPPKTSDGTQYASIPLLRGSKLCSTSDCAISLTASGVENVEAVGAECSGAPNGQMYEWMRPTMDPMPLRRVNPARVLMLKYGRADDHGDGGWTYIDFDDEDISVTYIAHVWTTRGSTMKLKRFEIVRWGVENAESAKYGLSDSCCPPISLDELTSLSSGMAVPASSLVPTTAKQGYGPLEGTSALRSQLAALYSVKATTRLRPEGVLVTQGTIAANNLAFNALLEPGDHVICQYPTWQQLYDYPRAMGAEVDLWKATRESNWIPKIEDLKQLVKSNTKLIVLKSVTASDTSSYNGLAANHSHTSNPNNPTGAILPKSLLQQIVNVASENGQIPILCDEVYRPVFHNISPMDADFPPSIMSLAYERAIVTSSLSKAYGIPGVRVGWLATRDPELASRCMDARDYCVMAVGTSDQTIAAYALSGDTMSALLSRNINVARKNLELLEKFVYSNAVVLDWVKPKAGTTTFIKISRQGQPVQSEPFCRKLLADAGVLLVPGAKCFGDEFEGYVRIGFAMETGMLEEGLRQLQLFLGSPAFAELPLQSS